MPAQVSSAFIAARLLARPAEAARALIYVADSERRAAEVARLIGLMAADAGAVLYPAWDCLPYDHASPSAEVMGARMAALRRLAQGAAAIVVTTPEALIQRTPPRTVVEAEPLRLHKGQALDPEALAVDLERLGYRPGDRVDEPGEYAIRGEVIDVFDAAGAAPHRCDIADGCITAIRKFDPASQRTAEAVDAVALGPASELVFVGEDGAAERQPGVEHALAAFYPDLATLFDFVPHAALVLEPGVQKRGVELIRQSEAAYRERSTGPSIATEMEAETSPSRPERLYLTEDAWRDRLEVATAAPHEACEPVPRFATERSPGRALAGFVQAQRQAGRRVVLAAGVRRDLGRLVTAAARVEGVEVHAAEGWEAALAAAPGAVLSLGLDADSGFVDADGGVALVAAADLLGSRVRSAREGATANPFGAADETLAPGDVVIHEDHGLGVLRGLETVKTEALGRRETVRIDYAKDARLLAPIEELGRVWRYGSEEADVTLDRLDGEAWAKRRQGIEGEIAHTARDLVALAKTRETAEAPKLQPPRPEYESFVAGFPFTPTSDQQSAIDAVLADLASGRPMDRLVVGDVGFGKTEVALRAAAAAVLAGRQVAVAAPTTVLVRQHVDTFRRRFAALGVEIAHLSRLVPAAEAKRVKAGLADGSIRLVIGTQALAGQGVAFADLGLLIVDEEHRFGAADKAKLKALGQGVHSLTLSATPIPRTLQQALVGLQDLSLIATPPARRRPIRTVVEPFDPALVKAALTREAARRGQSFVVVPRIEDLEPMRERLAALVPKLKLEAAHGRMAAADVDEAMVSFAEGRGDVLLATNIIESGLDVPRANTMLICDADRFGLAQLHQLRGRVGRGRTQGVCTLLTDPDRPVADATLTRLKALTAHDRLGAGMAISARDLDLRGAGELMGEEQTGHVNLIGLGLYQHLLELALRTARGEAVEDWAPEIKIEAGGFLPDDYVPEEGLRLNLYARLARAPEPEPEPVDGLADEIEDRFGPPPEPVSTLLQLARLRSLCRRWGVARIDAGPQALAYTLRPGAPLQALAEDEARDLSWKGERLIQGRPTETAGERLRLALALLGELE